MISKLKDREKEIPRLKYKDNKWKIIKQCKRYLGHSETFKKMYNWSQKKKRKTMKQKQFEETVAENIKKLTKDIKSLIQEAA